MSERTGTLERTSLTQAEIDASFEGIVELIDLNGQLETDLQADKIDELRSRRDALLERFLENPAVAFDHEFMVLSRLYEGRSQTSTDYLGSTTTEFVTRDPSRTKADLHFRELEYSNGNIERVVEVPRRNDGGLPFFISIKNGELRVAYTIYERGSFHRKEADSNDYIGQRLLTEFFTHSDVAGDLMYNRSTEDIAFADTQAKQFLRDKKRNV